MHNSMHFTLRMLFILFIQCRNCSQTLEPNRWWTLIEIENWDSIWKTVKCIKKIKFKCSGYSLNWARYISVSKNFFCISLNCQYIKLWAFWTCLVQKLALVYEDGTKFFRLINQTEIVYVSVLKFENFPKNTL